jgi:hypothetical protein
LLLLMMCLERRFGARLSNISPSFFKDFPGSRKVRLVLDGPTDEPVGECQKLLTQLADGILNPRWDCWIRGP